ncbi:hypothetical protein Pme01_50580 [Planosporangium mesophilum]|uniref:Uncharacterized protein n=1 Tax=Planosporangium mesophilum TaxID=689768 RepID=A0A8J3X306_9ACTN|nr:hypothetical protein Pme01_50580 [Planosporangium mesophilum]
MICADSHASVRDLPMPSRPGMTVMEPAGMRSVQVQWTGRIRIAEAGVSRIRRPSLSGFVSGPVGGSAGMVACGDAGPVTGCAGTFAGAVIRHRRACGSAMVRTPDPAELATACRT